MEDKRFIFFMDDCGTRTICKNDEQPDASQLSEFNFGLGGVIVAAEEVNNIASSVQNFCTRWDVPSLHGNKIRAGKSKFSFLKTDEEKKKQFFEDLDQLIIDERFIAHACIICRPGYRDRYADKYSTINRWDMSKTAFDISIERAAKFAKIHERKLTVVFERTGKKEDNLIKSYFDNLKLNGLGFDENNSSQYAPLTKNDFNTILHSIRADGKTNDLLQLADLVLHPMCHRTTGKVNYAYNKMEESKMLIDLRHPDPLIGIKYSCYDGEYGEKLNSFLQNKKDPEGSFEPVGVKPDPVALPMTHC